MVLLGALKTIIFVAILALIIGFLIFDSKILKVLVNKVNTLETKDEVYDQDISTSNKIYTYKLTSTNNYKIQDNIRKSRVGSYLVIKEVKKDKKSYLSVQCNGREIGIVTKKYLETVAPDFLKGEKYEFILSKIESINDHYYAYMKLYKSETLTENQIFDRSEILKNIDYRVGDKVYSKEYGEGVVIEIKMHSVVVKFKKDIKFINDYKSLKLIK